jgi:hypothetical protein
MKKKEASWPESLYAGSVPPPVLAGRPELDFSFSGTLCQAVGLQNFTKLGALENEQHQ